MSDEVQEAQTNNQAQPDQPAVTPAGVENTGKTADGREGYIPRDRFDTVNSELQQLKEWKRQQEQAQMSEVDRLKAQLSELEPIKQQAQVYAQVIEQVLQRELESVPEDKRHLIQGDTPAAKLQDLNRLKALGLFVLQPQQQGAQKATAVRYESGVGAQKGQGTGLTPAEEAAATRLGVSLEQYKTHKDALNK